MGQALAISSRRPAGRLLLASVILILSAVSSLACPICQSALQMTMGQKLDLSDNAVLAFPLGQPGRFRIAETIKGNVEVGTILVEPSLPAVGGDKPLLMLQNNRGQRWRASVRSDRIRPWLRQIAEVDGMERPEKVRSWPLSFIQDSLTETEWIKRVAVLAANLETLDPLAAEIAYGEISRAPYSALRLLGPQLDAERLSAWIDDPALVSRRSGYTLLLGVAGGEADAAALEKKIELAWSARDADNLSAMLAADLELSGPARVAWIERMYFADRQRTLPEIRAALLALSVHGGVDGKVSRKQVIEAYSYFIKVRNPMAAFVAMELADWGAWDVTADYVDIIRSKAVKDPAGQFAILSYLKSSPVDAGQAALVCLCRVVPSGVSDEPASDHAGYPSCRWHGSDPDEELAAVAQRTASAFHRCRGSRVWRLSRLQRRTGASSLLAANRGDGGRHSSTGGVVARAGAVAADGRPVAEPGRPKDHRGSLVSRGRGPWPRSER